MDTNLFSILFIVVCYVQYLPTYLGTDLCRPTDKATVLEMFIKQTTQTRQTETDQYHVAGQVDVQCNTSPTSNGLKSNALLSFMTFQFR